MRTKSQYEISTVNQGKSYPYLVAFMKPYWLASKTPSLVPGSALLFKTPIKRDLK